VTEPEINEERVAIEVIVAVLVWLVALVAAFYFVGVVAGLIVIMVGAGLGGLWLASMIRSSETG
jgi:hypothetical protein